MKIACLTKSKLACSRACINPTVQHHHRPRNVILVRSGSGESEQSSPAKEITLDQELSKMAKQTAATFAPRASQAKPNPAFKGSLLYSIFEWQAWISLGIGGLLSFNVLFPTDEPSIPRLLGMWSIWMFTVPSLRARECMPKEKDALNLLFVAIPLLNVTLPFLWKSFPFIFTADALAVLGTYYVKGVFPEVYGIPLEAAGATNVAESANKSEAE